MKASRNVFHIQPRPSVRSPGKGQRQGGAHPVRNAQPGWSRVPSRALVDFTRSFAVMLRARLSLVQSLTTAAAQCRHPGLQRVLDAVVSEVQGGKSLSESLSRHGRVFNKLYVHLTRVGEMAGVLDQVMLRLAAHLEKTAALKRKIRFAMFYPGLIMTVAVGAIFFFLIVIVPTFAEMYADFNQQLPGPTQVVLRLSQMLTEYAVWMVLGLGGVAFGIGMALRTPQGQRAWDRAKLRVPLLGSLLQKGLTARFCRTLGTLLSSGVSLVDALGILANASGNRYVEEVMGNVLGRVRRGSSLYAPLKNAGFFPDMVVQLIAVGEQTAELDAMLLHAAQHYEQELDALLDGLTAIIEPVLIVAIGVMLGSILVSLYLPMFELMQAVG